MTFYFEATVTWWGVDNVSESGCKNCCACLEHLGDMLCSLTGTLYDCDTDVCSVLKSCLSENAATTGITAHGFLHKLSVLVPQNSDLTLSQPVDRH